MFLCHIHQTPQQRKEMFEKIEKCEKKANVEGDTQEHGSREEKCVEACVFKAMKCV